MLQNNLQGREMLFRNIKAKVFKDMNKYHAKVCLKCKGQIYVGDIFRFTKN